MFFEVAKRDQTKKKEPFFRIAHADAKGGHLEISKRQSGPVEVVWEWMCVGVGGRYDTKCLLRTLLFQLCCSSLV